MTKVSIVGVEGAGKTVLMAALGDKYKLPDEKGYSLKPNNFETFSYVTSQAAMLKEGQWPLGTTGETMPKIGWTLQRSKRSGAVRKLGTVPLLDFAGEVYRLAFGPHTDEEIKSDSRGDFLAAQVKQLRAHVKSSQCLLVLVDLSPIINGDMTNGRTLEMVWLTQRIVDFARESKIPHVALGLTKYDRYRAEVARCGGVAAALKTYLPHVAVAYPDLPVFEIAAVGAVDPVKNGGKPVPRRNFVSEGLETVMAWMTKAVRQRRTRIARRIGSALLLAGLCIGGYVGWDTHQQRVEDAQMDEQMRAVQSPVGQEGIYKVIDLSTGSITHLDAVPSGGWTAGYKTRKIVLRRIEPGTFMMGSPSGEEDRAGNEDQHRVTLTKPFYMGIFEVTQGQWRRVMGILGMLQFGGVWRGRPVTDVSWEDCRQFCEKAGHGLRLPTEAEWEYACRAGTTTAYAGTGPLDDMGWYDSNSSSTTHEVGKKKPNAWGLYDMHGNVWEWCADWYGEYGGDATDPKGPASGVFRVYRGGGWDNYARFCRSAYRYYISPGYRSSFLGFRLACSAGLSE